MQLNDREHFDELIVKAVQSGKRETSGLVVEFTKTVEKSTNALIEHTKNDDIKFDVFEKKFEALQKGQKEASDARDDIIKMLETQNKDIAPMIKVFKDNRITETVIQEKGILILKGAGAVAVLYGAWEIIIKLIKQ